MMSDVKPYIYSGTDLLGERFHYQYTAYEGIPFLKSYLVQRETFRGCLEATRKTLLVNPTSEIALAEEIREVVLGDSVSLDWLPLRSRRYDHIGNIFGESDFETRTLLLDLWASAIYAPADFEQVSQPWIEFFLKRYEVTKRIYTAYGADLKPVGRCFTLVENYSLLATLFSYMCLSSKDLSILNTVLKLIDLIASQKLESQTPLTMLSSLIALEVESILITQLMAEHEIVV